MVVPFVNGDTLTAAQLNTAFGLVTPPVADLLAGDGSTFDVIDIGSGLTLNSGTLEATGSGGTVTQVDTGGPLSGGPIIGTGTISMSAIASGLVIANSGSVSAVPAAATVTALLDRALGSTQGNVLYRSGASWTVLAPGTSGQALTSGGASANVAWQTPNWNAGVVTSLSTGLSLLAGALSVSLTAAMLAALDLSTLPTSNPGGGKVWINGGGGASGALWVGAP